MTSAFGVHAQWETTLTDHVSALGYSPDGTMLAAGSLGGDSVVISRDRPDQPMPVTHHTMGVLCLDWSPDSTLLALGGQDGVVRVWRLHPAQHEPVEVGHLDTGRWIEAVAWSPDGSQLAIASGRQVLVTDAAVTLLRCLDDHSSTVTGVAWSLDGSRIGASCYGGVWWWTVDHPDAAARIMAWKGALLGLEVSPDGRWVAGGCQDASVHLWRLWSGEDLQMSGYQSKVERVAWDPTGRYLAVANPGEITVWSFAGKGPAGTAPHVREHHTGRITDLAYAPSGHTLASVGDDGGLALYDGVRRTHPSTTWQGNGPLSRVVWHPDGLQVAVSSGAGDIVVLGVTR
jgi:WD40 repeat protein